MLATSRVNRTRAAVGRDVDLLVDVGAVEQQRVGAGLALDGVAAVARVPDEGVVAGARAGPRRCRGRRLTRSSPWLPMIMSSPSPPLIVRSIWPALSAEASMMSSPPRPLTVSESMAPSVPAIVTCAASPLTTTAGAAAGDGDGVVAGRAVDDDGVGRAVALAAARRAPTGRGRPALTSVPVRSLTVMLSAPPRALKSMCSTPLRSMVMLATSRDEPHPAAVGRDVDVLGDVGAVEQQRVGAGLALDDVAAVARVPDERVVAGAEQGRRRCRGRR